MAINTGHPWDEGGRAVLRFVGLLSVRVGGLAKAGRLARSAAAAISQYAEYSAVTFCPAGGPRGAGQNENPTEKMSPVYYPMLDGRDGRPRKNRPGWEKYDGQSGSRGQRAARRVGPNRPLIFTMTGGF